MNKYSKAKVYTIRCRTDNTLIYVGSTVCSLSKRWGSHKGAKISKKYGLYTCIKEKGGFLNWYIELYENYPCESKEQLFKKEGEIIRLIGTLNSLINGRTLKEYYEDNKDKISEKKKIYHEENKDKITEKKKIYYIENKDKFSEKNKIYRDENKEKLLEKRKIKYTCPCGSTILIGTKAIHERSIKHTNYKLNSIL